MAHVQCAEGTFTTLCSAEGTTASETMVFTKADINVKCEVSCPAKITYFSLNATLSFVDKSRLGTIDNIIAGRTSDSEIDFTLDFVHILSWLKSYWFLIILVIILVIVFVCFIVPLLPTCISGIHSSVQKFVTKLKTKFNKLKHFRSTHPKTY